MTVPSGTYRTSDGIVNISVQNQAQWERVCKDVFNHPEWIDDVLFATNQLRVKNRGILEPMIEVALSSHTRESAEQAMEMADIPYGSFNDVAGLRNHPQHTARDRWFYTDSEHGSVLNFKPPFNIVGMPKQVGRIPSLGEHTDEIRRELGLA